MPGTGWSCRRTSAAARSPERPTRSQPRTRRWWTPCAACRPTVTAGLFVPLQAGGHGVLVAAAAAGPALLAADVAVAPVREGRSPAWGADLVTPPGLAEACRLVAATVVARAVSRRAVSTALTGNVLGALLAAVGTAGYGQRKAT